MVKYIIVVMLSWRNLTFSRGGGACGQGTIHFESGFIVDGVQGLEIPAKDLFDHDEDLGIDLHRLGK